MIQPVEASSLDHNIRPLPTPSRDDVELARKGASAAIVDSNKCAGLDQRNCEERDEADEREAGPDT